MLEMKILLVLQVKEEVDRAINIIAILIGTVILNALISATGRLAINRKIRLKATDDNANGQEAIDYCFYLLLSFYRSRIKDVVDRAGE